MLPKLEAMNFFAMRVAFASVVLVEFTMVTFFMIIFISPDLHKQKGLLSRKIESHDCSGCQEESR